MNQSLSPAKAAALFIVVVLAWGINWSVTKSLVEAVPPLWTASIRSWVALIALLVILRASGNLIIPRIADVPVVLSVALLHMTFFSTLVAAGLRYLPASKGVVLGYTTPLWVALAAAAARTERLGTLKLVGVALGLAGLGVILNPASLDWSNLHVLAGAGMIIIAAICWAANIIYIRSHRWIATPLQLLLWQVLVATLVLDDVGARHRRHARGEMVATPAAAVPLFRLHRYGVGLLGDVHGQQEPAGTDHLARHHGDADRRYRDRSPLARRADRSLAGDCRGPDRRWDRAELARGCAITCVIRACAHRFVTSASVSEADVETDALHVGLGPEAAITACSRPRSFPRIALARFDACF
ncbi:DMT family transporter [Bradyrhizobium sp. USDA 4522]